MISPGRISADRVTTLASSGIVDGAVRRIDMAYDDLSRPTAITSHSTPSGGSGELINQVKHEYTGAFNARTKTSQNHAGAAAGLARHHPSCQRRASRVSRTE